jgi:hypothetical protein
VPQTRGLSGKDSAFKHILAAFDANAVVVHLDHLDERLQVGLAPPQVEHATFLPVADNGFSRSGLGRLSPP